MKKITSYITTKVLRLVIAGTLITEWLWYILTFSNLPTTYTVQMGSDLKIITYLFFMTLLALLLEIVLNAKNKKRGSYLIVLVGSTLLFLWFMHYGSGFNYQTREELINVYEKRIVITGISISFVSVITQLFQIIQFCLFRR